MIQRGSTEDTVARYAEVLRLKDAGASYAEIAVATGYSEKSVYSVVRAALKQRDEAAAEPRKQKLFKVTKPVVVSGTDDLITRSRQFHHKVTELTPLQQHLLDELEKSREATVTQVNEMYNKAAQTILED